MFRRLEPQLTRPFCQSPIDCVFKWPSFHQFRNQSASPASSDGCWEEEPSRCWQLCTLVFGVGAAVVLKL